MLIGLIALEILLVHGTIILPQLVVVLFGLFLLAPPNLYEISSAMNVKIKIPFSRSCLRFSGVDVVEEPDVLPFFAATCPSLC